MIEFTVVREAIPQEFANRIQELLNSGWAISWQGAVPVVSGAFAIVSHVAHLSREA